MINTASHAITGRKTDRQTDRQTHTHTHTHTKANKQKTQNTASKHWLLLHRPIH